MSAMYLILFLCAVICASSDGYEQILSQISSAESVCKNDRLFGKFELSEVPQFGALCNIPPPSSNQVRLLLDNNAIPILCMGLYDVSVKLCKSEVNDTSIITKEIFPPSKEKFHNLFATLDESKKYSSLEIFCSSTVKDFTVTESASNATQYWWNILNEQLKNESSCLSICGTNNKKVQPLCSYIIWSNGIYLNLKKNQVESQASAIGVEVNDVSVKQPDQPIEAQKPNESLLSAAQSNPEADPPVQLEETAAQTPQSGATKLAETNTTVALAGTPSGEGERPITGEETLPVPALVEDTAKVGQKIPYTSSTKKNDTVLAIDTKPAKTETPKKKHLKKKVGKNPSKVNAGEANPPPDAGPAETNLGDNLETVPGSSELAMPKPPAVNQTSPQVDKADTTMVEGDFNFEPSPDGPEPLPADKDLQQPYGDEETNDDGDDVDMDSEREAAVPNKTGTGQAKPAAVGEQGPDRVYSDQEVGEVIIEDHFIEAEDSHFFTYFLCMAVLTIMAYLAFHNKNKLLALAVEGRRTRGTRRRPNCSNYSKLDCSLEEAMASNTTASVTHVLY